MSTPPRAARRAALGAFSIQGFTFASLATRLPEVKDDFGLEDAHILLLLAAVAVASGLGSLLAGLYAGRRGSAAALRHASALASVTVVLPSLMPDVATLVLATCVYGVFLGAVDAAMNMQGVAVQDAYGRPIMTGFHAMWSGAAVLGAVLASVTLELDLGLFLSMALVSLIGLAVNVALLGALLQHAPIDEPAVTTADRPAHHVPWLPIVLLAVPTTAMWLADSATSVWSGIYLTDGLDVAASAAPIAYAAYQLVLLLVRLVGDRLVAHHGAVRVIRVCGIASTCAAALIVWAPNLAVVYVGFGLLGGGLALVPPLSYVAAAHHDVEGGATAIARVNLANYAGYLLAAFTIALVAEVAGNRWMFLVPLAVVPLLPLMAARFSSQVARPSGAGREIVRP
ncbi:MFS transporter [Nocardioides humilatus]|uniref:MFS transporter n=1 Tax=Nocardioides humilatus TaxID=2607660 RepID=A0A5B1L9C1_9ACTN|nr:MFS transporter [Nocardioides humilatus]KAA1416894.1 MFS transporter [Nocardioides humilatus]